jgi:DNA-binding NarL/FixJ family response regulator
MGASALIIAGPGPLRDGLQALVGTMPQVGKVDVLSDTRSPSQAEIDLHPTLVLLDAEMAEDRAWLMVRHAKGRWPQARTIILVGSVEQRQEAEAAGADVVLLAGFPAGRLVAAIVRLLSQPVI